MGVLLSIEKFNSVRSDQNTLNLIQTKYRTKYLEMPAGGCFCNKIRVNFTGEPNAHLLCHCLDCRKIGGASYSNNIVVPEDAFNSKASQRRSPSKPTAARRSLLTSALTAEPRCSGPESHSLTRLRWMVCLRKGW